MAYIDNSAAWVNEAEEPADRARRARIVRARQVEYGLAVEVPPYITTAPEWAARWGEQAPPVGTVLRWAAVDGDLVGVAFCTGADEWYSTGESRSVSFASVARSIGNLPCSVAIGWREIPAVEARPSGDDAVKDWASQFIPRGESVPASQVGDDVQTGG